MKIKAVKLYNRVVTTDRDDATVFHVMQIDGHQVFVQQIGDDNKPLRSGMWIDCCYLLEPTHQQFLNYARSEK